MALFEQFAKDPIGYLDASFNGADPVPISPDQVCVGDPLTARHVLSQAEDLYWQNKKELPEYYASVDAGKLPLQRGYLMTPEDKIRRTTIMRLMCDLGLDYDAMSALLGVDFPEHFARELDSLDDMEADGLVVKTPQGLTVTDLGRLLIRNIAMRFDAYANVRKENRFSRTI